MLISGLYNRYIGRDIYIVGTGPTLRIMPKGFFDGRIAIGLNQAYGVFDLAYSITMHPELIVKYNGHLKDSKCKPTCWIAPSKKPPLKLKLDDARYYVYHRDPNWECFITRKEGHLFCGRGIQQTAIDLAGRMGAKSIILVGVDMSEVGGEHHATNQHVMFKGLPPSDVYNEYRDWTYKANKLAREHHGISVLSLSPLLGCGGSTHDADYVRVRNEMGLGVLPKPMDATAKLKRKNRRGTDPA